jgi:hypothetical protein
MTMISRICTSLDGRIAALPGVLLAAALVLASPAQAQTRPGGPSPFEQSFLNYLTSIASTQYCVTQSDVGTSTPASSNCNIARSYAFGQIVTGSEVRGLIPNQMSAENSQFKDFAGSQFHDLASRLSAIRAGATGTFAGLTNNVPNFVLEADKPTQNFVNLASGLTFVFKHGVQGYLRYRQILDQRYLTDHAIGAGFRVEL